MTVCGAGAALAGRFDVVPLERVRFGPGAFGSLGEECERLGISRLFVVVSRTLLRVADLRARLDTITQGRVAAVFAEGRTHTPHDVVFAATEAARSAGADGVLSIGGGTQIDLGKAVRLCLAEEIRGRDALLRRRAGFEYPDEFEVPVSPAPQLPQIAVSTTLSASEFTSFIGITDPERGVKDLYTTPASVPRLVVLDAELTRHTPRDLWSSTGVRAIDHAVETLCSISAQPITDALCADALRRLATHLPRSARAADDLEATTHCQLAAWQSIFGIANVSLGLSHGIGHQLGARCGVPHGLTSCVILPAVLEFNLDHAHEQQRLIAEIFGGNAAGDAGELLRQFIASLGLPTRLRDVGVARSDFSALARDAKTDRIAAGNPRPVTDEADVMSILERAW